MEKKEIIWVSCIHRTPGSDVDIFKVWFERPLTNVNQRVSLICKDFNINLRNSALAKRGVSKYRVEFESLSKNYNTHQSDTLIHI